MALGEGRTCACHSVGIFLYIEGVPLWTRGFWISRCKREEGRRTKKDMT